MNKIIFETKPNYSSSIKAYFTIVLLSGFFIFLKTSEIFNSIFFAMIISYAAVFIIIDGFCNKQVIFYETYLEIRQPLFLKFLKNKIFAYHKIEEFKIFDYGSNISLPSINIHYKKEESKIFVYYFFYSLIDTKTARKMYEILASLNIKAFYKSRKEEYKANYDD